jgi:hypothetical protein
VNGSTGDAASRSGDHGTTNTGGGGGAGAWSLAGTNGIDAYSGNGGSGIVVFRYKFQ